MNLAECVVPGLDFIRVSNNYAALTGLLAGFAFAGLVMVLTRRRDAQDELSTTGHAHDLSDRTALRASDTDDTVMLALMSAFYALVISTLVYSVIGGEILEVARNRAATEELIAGLPFGLAAMMLFYAVSNLMYSTGLFARYREDRQGRPVPAPTVTRAITVVLLPALTMFYLVNGIGDTETARDLAIHGSVVCGKAVELPSVGLVLAGVLVLLNTLAVVIGTISAGFQEFMHRLRNVASILVIVTTTGAAVAIGYVSTASPEILLSPSGVDTYQVAVFGLLAVTGVLLSAAPPRPSPRHPRE